MVNPINPEYLEIIERHKELECERKRMDEKVKTLRWLGSVIFESIGVYAMFASGGVLILGPRLLSVACGLAAVFMVAYWFYRAGYSLR